MTLHFHYDIVCPYAYLASTRVEALAAEAGITVRWSPVLLGGVLKAVGSPVRPMDAMPPAKAAWSALDQARSASHLGVPLVPVAAHPRRTVDAMRLLVAVDDHARPALSKVLFEAYWVHGLDVSDLAVLQRLAAPFDLDVATVVRDRAVRDRLFDATRSAVERGVFGVPAFRLGEDLWWGVDRLHFVRRALGLPDVPRVPRLAREGARVELFHDVASPFSYLAMTQVERLARETGAHVVCTPILLGALFRSIGTPMVPLHTLGPARQRYVRRDLTEWADWWGVPYRYPSVFPLRSLTAQRVLVQEPAAAPAVYAAAWGSDRDVSNPAVLAAVLDLAGFHGASLLAGASDPGVKEALRRNTDRAQGLGVCGVPTFLVGTDLLIWGQDRLDHVERALAGTPLDAAVATVDALGAPAQGKEVL